MTRRTPRIALASLALAAAHAASAQVASLDRQYPPQATYCVATKHGLPAEPAALIDGKKVALSPSLVIRDVNNRIVVNSYLPQSFEGMCVYGIGGALEKVWVMSAEQAARQKALAIQKAKASGSSS